MHVDYIVCEYTSTRVYCFQLSVMLDELLELVCTEVEVATVESAEASLTQLQEKLESTSKSFLWSDI